MGHKRVTATPSGMSNQRMVKKGEPKTENGKIIKGLMKQQGVKGSYKDFVILTPDGLMHWKGMYRLIRNDNGDQFETPVVALLHKRVIAQMFGKEIGKQFWVKNGRALAKL